MNSWCREFTERLFFSPVSRFDLPSLPFLCNPNSQQMVDDDGNHEVYSTRRPFESKSESEGRQQPDTDCQMLRADRPHTPHPAPLSSLLRPKVAQLMHRRPHYQRPYYATKLYSPE